MFVFAHTTDSVISCLLEFWRVISFRFANLVPIRYGCWLGPSATGKPLAGVSAALCQRSSASADTYTLIATVMTEGAVGKWPGGAFFKIHILIITCFWITTLGNYLKNILTPKTNYTHMYLDICI